MNRDKKRIHEITEDLKGVLQESSRYIWSNPEVGGEETKGSSYLRGILEREGFRTRVFDKMPNAFMAEWGEGHPVIGILGEYDALPGLSQKVSEIREPEVSGGPGHGCGHNLIGTASLIAAVAVKRYLMENGLKGTIRYFGCPEEELLTGKVKMVYHGYFEGTDAAITWHPMTSNLVYETGALASTSMRFRFKGVSSHAAVAPEKGRSALDAAELMNVGVNYLREHIIDKARVHYTINCGNTPPNIVHDKAENWYYVRAPHMSDVREISERVRKVAMGAAMMTETEVETIVESGTCEVVSTPSFTDLLQKNMEEAELPEFTEEELGFAEKILSTCDPESVRRDRKLFGVPDGPMMRKVGDRNLYKDAPLTASTDVGDVSFVMPLCMFAAACWPLGTAPHTWQVTSVNGTTIAEKGALYAAKVMAGTACDLIQDPDKLSLIMKEFNDMKDQDYAPMYFPKA